jgi:four helix bundle protein
MRGARNNLPKRAYYFSIQMLKFCEYLAANRVYPALVQQLIRSSSAMSSALLEGHLLKKLSEKERLYDISLEAVRETKYWLCLIRDTFELDNNRTADLLEETTGIGNMMVKQKARLKAAQA